VQRSDLFYNLFNSIYITAIQGHFYYAQRIRPFQPLLKKLDTSKVKQFNRGRILRTGTCTSCNFGIQKGVEVFPKVSNFYGHKLRGSAFTYMPFSYVDPNGLNHGGFEYRIAYSAASSLHMDLVVKSPADGGWWGSSLTQDEANYTGTTKDTYG
jgi:hypothetical protein